LTSFERETKRVYFGEKLKGKKNFPRIIYRQRCWSCQKDARCCAIMDSIKKTRILWFRTTIK